MLLRARSAASAAKTATGLEDMSALVGVEAAILDHARKNARARCAPWRLNARDYLLFSARCCGVGRSVSFETRHDSSSPTRRLFSDGQAISWIHANLPGARPRSPICPKSLPSSVSL